MLQAACSPLGFALLGLCLSAWLCVKRPRLARILSIATILVLSVASMPIVADEALRRLEDFTPARPLADEPYAPVIVVLGGTVAIYTDPNYPAEEIAGSRISTAAKLYAMQKATQILVTSGIEYQRADGSRRTEADDMRELLIALGVPAQAILTEGKAKNTKENAHFSAKTLRELNVREILLVTSAYHLKRSTELFRAEALTVHPVAAGRVIRPKPGPAIGFVPTAHALSQSTTAWKEFLGSAFDRPLSVEHE